MSFDDLLLYHEVQAAFLTAALLPYSEAYAKEKECDLEFVKIACNLYVDICTSLDTLNQL